LVLIPPAAVRREPLVIVAGIPSAAAYDRAQPLDLEQSFGRDAPIVGVGGEIVEPDLIAGEREPPGSVRDEYRRFADRKSEAVDGDPALRLRFVEGPAQASVDISRPEKDEALGELWQAVSGDPVKGGEPLRIARVGGLTLTVERPRT